MKFLNLILVLLTISGISSVNAEQNLSAQKRSYTFSCGYYSSKRADVLVEYRDTELDWGTEITLLAGWAGYHAVYENNQPVEKRFEWDAIQDIPMASVAPYTWSATASGGLAARSSNRFANEMDFVLRVKRPDGSIQFVKGSETTYGFYRINLGSSNITGCVSDGVLPNFEAASIESVYR